MNYTEIDAQTRFSDFDRDGYLHFSKCLMYFEKARFQIARDAGLDRILRESYPGRRVQFVIAKVDVAYNDQVPVCFDRNEDPVKDGGGIDFNPDTARRLVVRSRLKTPFVSKLAFVQELVDAGNNRVLIHADIDVALLQEGEGLIPSLNEACRKCLQDYCDKVYQGE